MIVLMGMLINENGDVRRDIALIEVNCSNMIKDAKSLLEEEYPSLMRLEPKRPDLNCMIWEQKNIKTSRKQLLPILKGVL